ncbi:MAG: arginase family protein [Actinomycetota bacterium]|nr:arginase family protein [Actinomycetota bacterium]
MDRPVSLVALRCRTSDRTPNAATGVDALAPLMAKRLGREPRSIGTPAEPRAQSHYEDLRVSRGCLLEAGGQVDDTMDAGGVPVVLAPECSVALTTLPTALRHRPDARVLWLDAHGDFNTPDTSPSGYLGGMCLAGACGLWDPGLGLEQVDPARVVLAGVRELDDEERRMLGRSEATVIGASTVETLVAVSNALERAPVFVHLDLDVLDPEFFPAQSPAPGGLAPERLLDVLEAVAGECELVGLEVTSFEAPEDAEERSVAAALVLSVLEPLLEAVAEEANVIG